MTITAKALYDYCARNEKELSFMKGCSLEVVEKTLDGNWWDGYYEGKRGYIPVSYVEIAELQSVPVPPARKSSMQPNKESSSDLTATPTTLEEVSEVISETMPTEDNITPEVKTVSSVKKDTVVPPAVTSEPPPTQGGVAKPSTKPSSIMPGKVSKLTEKFQSPTHTTTTPPAAQQQPARVLFNPHRRNPSADLSSGKQPSSEGLTRSGSGGSKHKPPPVRPKPEKETITTTNVGGSPFPLMSHDTGASASPLQQAHLQQVVGSGIKKPAPIMKRGSRTTGSSKKKGEKPPLASKPAPPTKPGGNVDLQAELAAATRRRKQDEEQN